MANLKYFEGAGTTVLGQKLGSPIGFGAFPHQGMVHKDAEKASAMAAAELGQLYTLSSSSTCSLEEVAAATNGKG